MVHRDIKPENILLTDGRGAGRRLRHRPGVVAAGGERLTETGLAVGTPAYMSPEQASGGAVDARSDIYASAACSTRCWRASRPSPARPRRRSSPSDSSDPPPSINTMRPDVPAALGAALDQALA